MSHNTNGAYNFRPYSSQLTLQLNLRPEELGLIKSIAKHIQYSKMADANNEAQAQILDTEITSVCEKLQTIHKREKEISSATTDIDIVEKGI